MIPCDISSASVAGPPAQIDSDLAAGHLISDVSLKHFGNYGMWQMVRRHKRSHIPKLDSVRANEKEGVAEETR
jgi:hypothetical protein